MPFGDGTGPMGMGSMTGRGMGYCAGSPTPGYMNPRGGRGWFGFIRGHGGGRGWRHWYYATGMPGWMRFAQGMPAFGMGIPRMPVYPSPPTPEDESAMLKDQAEFLRQQLEKIQKRINDLESTKS